MIGDKFLYNLNIITHITEVICWAYGIDKLLLSQEKITKKNMAIRQIIIYLYYHTVEVDRLSLSTIGAYFGGMSLSNVENAKNIVQERMETYKDFKNEIEILKTKLT